MRKSQLVLKSLLAVLMVANMVVLYQYVFGVKGPADGELPFAIMQEVGGWLSDGPNEPETAEASPATATTVTTVAESLTPSSEGKSAPSARADLDNTGYVLVNRPSAESTSTTRTVPPAVAEMTLTTSVPVTLVTMDESGDKKADKSGDEVGFGTAAYVPDEAKPATGQAKPPSKTKPAPKASAAPSAEKKPAPATAKAAPAQKKAAPQGKLGKSAERKATHSQKAAHKQKAAKPAQKRAAPAKVKATKSAPAQSQSKAASGDEPSPSKGKKK